MGPAAVSGVSKVLPPAAKPKQRKAKKPEAKKPECQVSASTKEPEQKTPLVGISWTSAQDQDIQDLDQVIQDLDQPGDGFASMDYSVGSLVWVHCHWLSGQPVGPVSAIL